MSQDRSRPIFSPARQPFLYLMAALMAGVLVDRWIEPARLILTTLAVVSVVTSIKLVLGKKKAAATVALLISFTAAGAVLSRAERTSKSASRLESLYESRVISPDDPVELTGTLATPPEPAPLAYFLEVDARSIRVRDQIVPATGRVRLMISPSDDESRTEFDDLALDYGARVRVLVRLERARSYANPGSPDFNDFLERHGYDLKGVIKSPLLIEHEGDESANPALALLYHWRLLLMKALDSRFSPRVAGTLKAMLTGNRYFLDPETVERLRESSTFHTLVIAGLHIGIIALVLLGGRSALKRRKTLRVIVCLIVLWAYAVMVGLAPPVTRATTMITFGLIGPLLFRQSASLNSVALAAFVMLALKPALVADPGFQLSFVAVAGIVSLALPLATKLQAIGAWRPTSHTPHPPSCSRALQYFADMLFWDERAFREEMRRAPIRYALKKARAARVLGQLRVQSMARGAVLLVITSAAIQLSTLPLMALYFNRVAPVGILLNVVAGLLTGVLMLSALGAITAGWLSTGAATLLGSVANLSHYLLVNAIAPFVDIPFATFRVAHHEGWHSIIYGLYFVPLGMLAILIERWQPVDRVAAVDGMEEDRAVRRKISDGRLATSHRLAVAPSLLCVLAVMLAIITVIRPTITQASGRLTIHFLDVGQGDSALVVFPHGKTMLVDGGGEIHFGGRNKSDSRVTATSPDEDETDFPDTTFSIGEAVVSRFIWSLGRTRVDYVLATHAHADHMAGLSDVVRNMRVGEAIIGHRPASDFEYGHFEKSAGRHGIPVSTVERGEHFEIDGVGIDVLWPMKPTQFPVTSGNDDSVVLRLVYGSVSILLAGDIEQSAEDSLVASGAVLNADVLKVPHHGSKTSSTEAFIDAVNPKYAVISVGERSRFGHPHRAVVNRYLERGIKLLQTGRDGMVTVKTDGRGLEVRTFRE
jgi:competence protein ComEC